MSIRPTFPAVYSGDLQFEKVKSAAISNIKSRSVNPFPRQTLPVRRCIQISARRISTLPNCPVRLGLWAGLLISRVLCFQRRSYGASPEKAVSPENPRSIFPHTTASWRSPRASSSRNSDSHRSGRPTESSCQARRVNDLFNRGSWGLLTSRMSGRAGV